MKAVKTTLGVRTTTANDLVLAETGLNRLKAVVKHKQKSFFTKMLEERVHMDEDPLGAALQLIRDRNTRTWREIKMLYDRPDNILSEDKENIRVRIQNRDTSKFKTYLMLNPTLSVHEVYESDTPEFHRKQFTRLRLISHSLKIETGRWQRVPKEQRLCTCRRVQSEEHVLLQCPQTAETIL